MQGVTQASADISRADTLFREGKTQEALSLFESIYTSLPDAPLTQETRLAARSGYISTGCARAQELALAGQAAEASQLLDKLASISPSDTRIKAARSRLTDPDRLPPALTAAHIENVKKVEALLLKGNSFLELGDYDNANRTYQDVLRIDPYNSAARRGMERAEQKRSTYFRAAYDHQRSKLLSEVDRHWEDPVPPATADLNAMFGARASSVTGIGRESILDKLHTYQMPRVEFEKATIDEVIELLRLRSRDLDPQGKGIDFVISLPDENRKTPISLSMQNVPMDEVLRYVAQLAGVTYRVEQHAVVISSFGEQNTAMITRSFRVPPDFIQSTAAGAAGAAPLIHSPLPPPQAVA
ncbi:MAG: tetratricopeptide repeat protein [Verrucomicrobiaceae bacterium]|nr:tetratricopeptide repeat protein [Verrucomicrobiaceae bacterium]